TQRKKSASLGGVNSGQLTMFTRQFATLIEAGLPIVRGLKILEEMLPPGVLRNAVMDVHDDVEQGSQLSDALAKHPKAFDSLYVSMVNAGEMGGVLDSILARLAEFREKSEKIKKQIIGAMIYPAAIMCVAAGIMTVIMIVVIPKFREMFESMDVEMPGMTIALLNLADLLKTYWYLIPGIPFLFMFIYRGIKSTKGGRYVLDVMFLHLPIFGLIIKKTAVSRFCRTLGVLTASGVPILDALSILRNSVGNAVVEEAVGEVHNSIREGDTIADPLSRSSVFDHMAVNMVMVGEETGELDKMLIRVADIYDNDVDAIVAGMMGLLEPFILIGLGGGVGFIVISLFLPLISIMENIG
ncbi:MAG: type II secretion system F family protein, partial [Planctomycetes bacterium]|nr:type II secretion system F family protein [Planctomycetota bacterium]